VNSNGEVPARKLQRPAEEPFRGRPPPMEIRRLRRQKSPPPLPHGGQSRPARRSGTQA